MSEIKYNLQKYKFISKKPDYSVNYVKQNGTDEKGNININLVDGVENFENKVLFLIVECKIFIPVHRVFEVV